MSNLFYIYLSSDMFLFMATSYAQCSLKIARLGSLDDSVDRHVEEGECSRCLTEIGARWQQVSLVPPQWMSVGLSGSSQSCPSMTFLKQPWLIFDNPVGLIN